MKKLYMMMALITVLALVLVGCAQEQVIEDTDPPAASTEESMDKEEGMTEESMDKEEDMHDESMDKEDEMKDDSMDKKEDMEEENMMKNEGDMAPTFSLTSIDGEKIALADLKGEKVYVKFWASWCSICVSGLGDLEALSEEDTDFRVVTIVSPDNRGEKSIEKFKDWYAKKGIDNLTILFDEGGNIFTEYGIRGVPTSAYIGSDGVLIKVAPGHVNNDMIKDSFTKIY
jgi:peroxiredoxin